MNGGEFIGFVAILMMFGIPLTAIWTSHRQKMREMELRMRNQGDEGVRATVEALRQEVRSLRDTTTQYDISFDSALHRMEERVESLERRSIDAQNRERYTNSTPDAGRAVEIQSGR